MQNTLIENVEANIYIYGMHIFFIYSFAVWCIYLVRYSLGSFDSVRYDTWSL